MLENPFSYFECQDFIEMVCPTIISHQAVCPAHKVTAVNPHCRRSETRCVLDKTPVCCRANAERHTWSCSHTNTYRQSCVSNCLPASGLRVTWIAIIMAGKPTCPIYARYSYTPLQSRISFWRYAGVGLFLCSCQVFFQTNVFIGYL